MTRPVVFLGPSLPVAEARDLFAADYRPPVAQGNLYRAALEKPPAIAIIDGVFRNTPTVRHREILWALSQGIPVFGAASMGALRAAEMHIHGMIGVGLIYRWYRRFPLLPDDAVAVTHGPAELGSVPLSDALVDIRRSLKRAARRGAMPLEIAEKLAADAAQQPFPDRRLPEPCLSHRVAQKAQDARALLTLLAAYQDMENWPKPPRLEPPIVHAWLDDLRDSGLPLPE